MSKNKTIKWLIVFIVKSGLVILTSLIFMLVYFLNRKTYDHNKIFFVENLTIVAIFAILYNSTSLVIESISIVRLKKAKFVHEIREIILLNIFFGIGPGIIMSKLKNHHLCPEYYAIPPKKKSAILKEKRKGRTLNVIKKVIIYTLLTFWAIMIIFPFFFMVLTSFKSLGEYTNEAIPKLYSASPTFENYRTAFEAVKLSEYMMNTLIFALTTTFIMLFVSILAAFAFSRLNFRGKNLVFTLFLAMMMIPNELVIITNYTSIVNLGLNNTFMGLILPSVLSVFYIYLLRQNFMQVPDSLYLAAKVDGTTDFGYLTKILIPLSKPTIVTITILKLIECWNSYVWPRLITTEIEGKPSYFLVSNAIEKIRTTGFGRDNIPAMMAAVVCISFPLLVLFLIFRERIMSGVSRSGTKG